MAFAQQNFYTIDDYYQLPENTRAELINGTFYYMAAPSRIHQEVVHFLDRVIGNYIASKNGSCKVYPAPFAVRLFRDEDIIVEPDISVICDPGRLTDRGCTGAPDWIIEVVSPSTASHDYIRKLQLYADAGVREYWILDPTQKSAYIYHLEETHFQTSALTFRDKIKVNIYDDLYIDLAELKL